ncbi:endonuclease/exonuclease/phosphatase family protein [Jongsikchunia kroppenstedtii]|uniref:endonuclease/exonuclease/phosphatase family protein n=1 Tax=Jongsikchunia kroppenstedtii TaxID=1121721 RepID=UPI0003810C64|nr:endonuclease/exonuclease/phosphatase family protein [Jongsikchunia kroppenstedtii]
MPIVIDKRIHVLGALDAATTRLPALPLPRSRWSAVDGMGVTTRTGLAPAAIGALVGVIVGTIGGAIAGSPGAGAGYGALAGAVIGLVWGVWRFARRPRRVERPAPAAIARGPQTLKVLEYNVHGGMGGPGEYWATSNDLNRLADEIAKYDPDIVLMQELDRFAFRSNFTDTLAALRRRLNPDGAVMAPSIEKIYGREEGPGILTFHGITIVDSRGLRIPDPFGNNTTRRFRAIADNYAATASNLLKRKRQWHPFRQPPEYQPRGAADTLVRLPDGTEIRVISGHFSSPRPGADEQRRQIDAIAETVGSWDGPTILGADFNVRDGSPEFAREHEVFAAVGLQESTAGAPPNSDRVYASRHFTAANPQKLVAPEGVAPASDHSPVLVELTMSSSSANAPSN